MINLRPLNDRIVVRVDKAPLRSEGGIHLPDVVRDANKPQRGEVLAVGPGKRVPDGDGNRHSLSVKVGDVVFFTRYGGDQIKDLGDDVLILREDDVLGVEDK